MSGITRAMGRSFAVAAVLLLTLSACSTPDGSPSRQSSADTSTGPSTAHSTDSSTASASPGELAPNSPTEPGTSPVAPPSPSAPSSGEPGAGNASLTVSIKQSAEATPTSYTLECVGGKVGAATTLPNGEAACAAIMTVGERIFFAKPDPNRICTQQYGGPQTATITGTFNGRPVLASFSLKDGCEIARWNALRAVLGSPGAT